MLHFMAGFSKSRGYTMFQLFHVAVSSLGLFACLSVVNSGVLVSMENQCPEGSLSLNFSTTRITKIGPGFLGSPSITCLDLRGNAIDEIAENAFASLPNLEYLYLSTNYIKHVTNLLNSNFPKMKILDLKGSNHQGSNDCHVKIAGNFTELRQLSLQGYFICQIVISTGLIPYPKLEHFDLSGNGFAHFRNTAELPDSLLHLNLSNNQLYEFEHNYLTRLVSLDLSMNQLQSLYYSSFKNLRNLEELFVSSNHISGLPNDALANTKSLIVLDLSDNLFESISPGIFDNLNKLQILNLSNNWLRGTSMLGSSLKGLLELRLDGNRINIDGDAMFSYTPNLKALHLKNNQITAVNVNAFENLKYLEYLDLSTNSIESLPEGWCDSLSSLTSLNLKNNKLSSLEYVSISSTVPLKHLYLAANSLEYIKWNSLASFPENLTLFL